MAVTPFIAMIIPWAPNFAPRGWAFCQGQLLPIAQNQSLFSLLGTTYGGDGRTTFALPDLRSRVAIHPGQGPGLANYRLGAPGGQENVSLNVGTMPAHAHPASPSPTLEVIATTNEGDEPRPASDHRLSSAKLTTGQDVQLYRGGTGDTELGGLTASGADATTQSTGGGQTHPNRQPFLVLNYIIALQGVFPSRN